ncbi:MAG TPA: hypothetical protein VF595_02780 [Tepidisphaeraceae bacterium]|jgi:hypothetical protein
MPWFVLALLAAVTVGCVGVWLLRVGLRGRRIDDHPLCRRCGFDLTGHPETTPVCGECGADLAARNAIRVGHRSRRTGSLLAGGVAVAAALAVLSVVGISLFANVDWQRLKPLAWLMHNAVDTDPATRRLALDTIAARYKNAALTPAQLDALIARALDVQGDLKQPWDPKWGDWIQAEHAAGRLAADRWLRYARQAVPPISFMVRSSVRRGDRLPYTVGHGNSRVADRSNFTLRSDSRHFHFEIDGLPLPDLQSSVGLVSSLSHNSTGHSQSDLDLAAVLDRLPDGTHTVRLRRHLSIREGFGTTTELAAVDGEDTATFDLQTPSTVTFKHDPSLRPAVEAAVRVRNIARSANATSYIEGHIEVHADPLPVGLGYEIILRYGGREWSIGGLATPARKLRMTYGIGNQLRDLPADAAVVDIELRPDAAAAQRTTDTFEIWDEPLIFRQVPLAGARPTSGPTTGP